MVLYTPSNNYCGIFIAAQKLKYYLSSRWLVKKGKFDRALKVLSKIRQGSDEEAVKQELSDIKQTIQTRTDLSSVEIFRELFTWKIMQRYNNSYCVKLDWFINH